MIKSKKSCKRIHLVTDDGLYDQKAFYKVEIVFYLSSMNDFEFINCYYPTEPCRRYLYQVENITSKLHNASASIAFIKKALFVDVIPKFTIGKGKFINEMDSLTASRKLMKSHLTQHVQDLYNLSIQDIDLKSLLYSNIGIALGNTLINIAQRSLSKRRYLFFKTKKTKDS